MVERDDHHTLSQRKMHEVYEAHQSIRENPSMIAHGLARAAHTLLHLNTAHVPPLSYYTALRVANRLDNGLYILDGIDQYSILAEESAQHPRIKPIEIKQDALSVEALRAQIPYIKHGMPSRKKIIDLSAGRGEKTT